MATHMGKEGKIEVGGVAIAEIRSFEVTETGDTAETTTMGDTARSHGATLTGWTGSCEAFWDETDTNGQVVMTIGSSAEMTFAPEDDDTTGDVSLVGTAIVTERAIRSTHDGVVEISLSFQGTGALTLTTAA